MTDTQRCTIVENINIAKDTWQMRLTANTAGFAPGHFVNVAVPGFYLRRPLAVCDYDDAGFTMVYRTVGGGTHALAQAQPGDVLDVLAPLGNGFSRRQNQKVLLAGGGVGLAPLYALAKRLAADGCAVDVACGFNTADEVYLFEAFTGVAARCVAATADGSFGVRGLVNAAITGENYDWFYACGPTAMLKALCQTLPGGGEVSLEERMACGFGGCMGCAIETVNGMKRVCRDGPVFQKGDLLW